MEDTPHKVTTRAVDVLTWYHLHLSLCIICGRDLDYLMYYRTYWYSCSLCTLEGRCCSDDGAAAKKNVHGRWVIVATHVQHRYDRPRCDVFMHRGKVLCNLTITAQTSLSVWGLNPSIKCHTTLKDNTLPHPFSKQLSQKMIDGQSPSPIPDDEQNPINRRSTKSPVEELTSFRCTCTSKKLLPNVGRSLYSAIMRVVERLYKLWWWY